LLPPAALEDPADLFDERIYLRGGMTLEALRQEVGSHDFFVILRRWAQRYEYGNVSTADFIALSERGSGKDLDAFFHAWLEVAGRPALASGTKAQSASCSMTIWAAERRVRSARTALSRDAEASPQAGVITMRVATGGSRPRSRSGPSTRRAT
jgi:aminopeptidase N